VPFFIVKKPRLAELRSLRKLSQEASPSTCLTALQSTKWVAFPSSLTLTIFNNFTAINGKYLCDCCGIDVVKSIWGKWGVYLMRVQILAKVI